MEASDPVQRSGHNESAFMTLEEAVGRVGGWAGGRVLWHTWLSRLPHVVEAADVRNLRDVVLALADCQAQDLPSARRRGRR